MSGTQDISEATNAPANSRKESPPKQKPNPVDRIDTTKADKKDPVLDFYYTQMKDDIVNFELVPATSSGSSKTSSKAASPDGFKAVFTVTRADPAVKGVLDVSKFIPKSEAGNLKIFGKELKSKFCRVTLKKEKKEISIKCYFTPDSPNQTSSDEDPMEVEQSKPMALTE